MWPMLLKKRNRCKTRFGSTGYGFDEAHKNIKKFLELLYTKWGAVQSADFVDLQNVTVHANKAKLNNTSRNY